MYNKVNIKVWKMGEKLRKKMDGSWGQNKNKKREGTKD